MFDWLQKKDWRSSPAHLLLLSKFRNGDSPTRYRDINYWETALGEKPANVIEQFIKERMLARAGLPELISYKFNSSDLKSMLKENGLKVSGRKKALIHRLIENEAKAMSEATKDIDLYRCTAAGAQLAENYLTTEKTKRESTEREIFDLLVRKEYSKAVRVVRVINKGLTDEDLAQAAIALSQAGIANLRLYFMVGLPTETLDDVREIPRLVKYLMHRVVKESRGKKALGQITLSLSSFVPKAFTPFQWVPFMEVVELKRRQRLVQQELRGLKEVRVHADLPKCAYTQALLARGDRRAGEVMLAAHEKGWPRAFKESPVNPDFFVYRERGAVELFPWDFTDHGIEKHYLWEEYQAGLAEKETPPCQPEVCRRCGPGRACPPARADAHSDRSPAVPRAYSPCKRARTGIRGSTNSRSETCSMQRRQ